MNYGNLKQQPDASVTTDTPVAGTPAATGANGAPVAAPLAKPPGYLNSTSATPPGSPGGPDLLPAPGPKAGFDKSLGENLAILGQGGTDIAHGIYNFTRSSGNYATMGGIDRALGAANQYLPAGTPDALRPNPYASQQRYTQQARNEMGPGLDTLAMLQGWRGFSKGVGGYGAGPAAEAVAGTSVLNPALQFGVYKGGESLIEHPDDPKTAGVNAAKGFGWGLGGGVLANKVLSPVLKAIVTKYYGGSTPESITEKLNQTASTAEQQAAAQAAAAQAPTTADETLNNLRFNRKDLGFEVGTGNQNPTYAQLQAELENFKNIKPAQDEAGAIPVLQRKIAAAFQGPDVAEAQAAAAAARDRATASVAPAQQLAADARARANTAQWLASAGRTAGLPGANVPAQATEALTQPGLSPLQIEAYKRIAQSGVPGKGPQLWEAVGKLLGGGAGGYAGSLINEPGVGALVGQQVGGDLASKLGGPSGAAATQAAIARAWPGLTGEYPAAARGQAGAFDAIRTLYGLK